MSGGKDLNNQEIGAYIIIVLAVLWAAFSLGPQVLIMAAVSALVLTFFRAKFVMAVYVALASAFAGMLWHQDLTFWLTSPVNMMHTFYASAFPGSLLYFFVKSGELAGFMDRLIVQSWNWFKVPELWLLYAPAGGFCGACIYGFLNFWFQNPLGSLKRQKQMNKNHGKVGDLPSAIINQKSAETAVGSLIGTDRYARRIELSDKCANQHTLVLGTTGSGKTVTVCNIVESAIRRGLPLIYIDGKGDYDLACRVARFGRESGRPVSVFAMKGESIAYNPLSCGGFTSKKDRIIELREWTEEHYKKLAEGYLQSVFKVMDSCGIPSNMVSLSENLDLKKLKALVRQHEADIPDAQALMDELNNQDQAFKSIESLTAEIRNFTASEIGPLFRVEEDKPVLTLDQILAENGVAYFCLPALEFPSMAQTLGRLVINDLKATMAQQLGQGVKKTVYVIFDEFSVFAGEQVLNVINMG
ncbi:MAG: DUF853 family protein, partial [Alphaproteobacteria bacterium]|nr:DUF853 family protein [Alphaproteobacteria bacterium]